MTAIGYFFVETFLIRAISVLTRYTSSGYLLDGLHFFQPIHAGAREMTSVLFVFSTRLDGAGG
jgi:hypothetical protein